MEKLTDTEIKDLVKERYGGVARGAGASCCDDSCCAESSDIYALEQIEGLPDEAVMASAGCGNPTAIGSLNTGETVVDFGSGGGIDCFLAARAVGPSGKVIGVDMTSDMVNLARSNADKLGLSNVEFHLTEMEHTPIEAESADVIISNCVINLAPDKEAVFGEAFRILRPGGRLFVSDMVLANVLPDDVAADTDNWVTCLAGAELKDVYLGRMRDAGFREVEVVDDNVWEGGPEWRSGVHSMNIRATKPAG